MSVRIKPALLQVIIAIRYPIHWFFICLQWILAQWINSEKDHRRVGLDIRSIRMEPVAMEFDGSDRQDPAAQRGAFLRFGLSDRRSEHVSIRPGGHSTETERNHARILFADTSWLAARAEDDGRARPPWSSIEKAICWRRERLPRLTNGHFFPGTLISTGSVTG